MARPLQSFGYRDSPYIRPGQKWVCGNAADGCPCQNGPDDRGRCRGGYECEPVKNGDRWSCTRSQFAGGPCAEGPLPDGTCCREIPPCRPVRSWRARRGAVVRWVLALSVGLLIFVMASGYRTGFISPGELSFQHAELADCGVCHGAFHEGVLGWWRAAWSEDVAVDDSKPCISCHKMGARGLLPHSLPAGALEAMAGDEAPRATAGGRSVGVQLANLVYGAPTKDDAALPCMTCHGEHQGAEADLTALSDDRCTSCHRVQFHSLASGHPDVVQYPYERRTQLQFDHTSHIDKHFQDAKFVKLAPGQCYDCHKPDVNGRLMEVKPFETSCGACHGAQVAGAGRASAKGMAVFAVPGLDVASLRDQGAAIGEWPEYAEGSVPPFMNLLLSADPDYRAANAVYRSIDDPLDLSEADEQQLAAVATVAWGVKSLLYDLRTKGVEALHLRLRDILGRPLSPAEKATLTALLPLDTIAVAQKEWFPALGTEIPRWRGGETVLMPSDQSSGAGETGKAAAVTPVKQDSDSDAEIDTGKDDDDEIATGKDKDDDEIATGKEDDDDEISTGKDGDKDDDEIATGKDKDDDEIATGKEDDDDEISTGKDGDKDDDEIATDKDDGEAAEKDDGGGDNAAASTIAAASGEDWNSSGGWYRDDFILRYRPTGHADGFIRAWLDLTASSGGRMQEGGQLFEDLIDSKAPGLCSKCHSVDQQADGALKVNWRGYKPAEGTKLSVHFSHAAHFSLLDERGCSTCHDRNAKADYAAGFKDRDPATFTANFKPLPRAVCAECHTAAKAGDKCLTCHNYHLGVYKPVIPHTEGMLRKDIK